MYLHHTPTLRLGPQVHHDPLVDEQLGTVLYFNISLEALSKLFCYNKSSHKPFILIFRVVIYQKYIWYDDAIWF